MTIEQVIKSAKGIKPNAFSNDTITMWINEVEGMVQTDVMLLSLADVITYNYDEHKNTELLVKTPHDKIYVYFVVAMIDFANNEYNLYTNTLQLFNKYFADYTRWYALRINPANGRADIEGYYLSAYALALKHGYTGTEEEWIASLKGERGEQGHGWIVSGFVKSADDLPGLGVMWNGIYIREGVVFGVGAKEPYEFYVMAITDDRSHRWIYQGPFSPILAQSWAVGDTGYREGENTDNAKYYSEQAKKHADEAAVKILAQTTAATKEIGKKEAEAIDNFDLNANKALELITNGVAETKKNAQDASGSARIAEDKAILAKSWAEGGTTYREGENTNNAKYYSEEAKKDAETSSDMAGEAESWAHGETGIRDNENTDNAMYYSDKARESAASANYSAHSADVSRNDALIAKNDALIAKEEAERQAQLSKKYSEFINPIYSNALKRTTSGVGVVRIDDISPVPHDIEVKVSSKNILDLTSILGTSASINSDGIAKLECGADGGITGSGTPTEALRFSHIYLDNFDREVYTLSASGTYSYFTCVIYLTDENKENLKDANGNNILFEAYKDKETTINFALYPEAKYIKVEIKRSSANEMSGTAYFQLEKGTVATPYTPYVPDAENTAIKTYGKNLFSGKSTDWKLENGRNYLYFDLPCDVIASKGKDEPTLLFYKSNDGWTTETQLGYITANGVLITKEEGYEYKLRAVANTEDKFKLIQMEVGIKPTEYEPYKEPIKGAVSVHPTTTVVADTAGVEITAEYNRDINKAFAELEKAIANL